MEKLTERLKSEVNIAKDLGEDMDCVSWNYQNGILISVNEAKQVIELLNQRNELLASLKSLLQMSIELGANPSYKTIQAAKTAIANTTK